MHKPWRLKPSQVDDKNLKGLLAYQAYLFNRDYEGQTDHPDIYNALYNALAGFNGDNYNSLPGHEGSVKSLAFLPGIKRILQLRVGWKNPALGSEWQYKIVPHTHRQSIL